MYQKTTLTNGLRLLTAPLPHTRSASVCIFIGTGSRYETASEAGVSHFIEHMLFKGTQRRPAAREISEAIEGVGGILNGGTDKELTVYWAKVPANYFWRALDVLSDMILNPRFDPEETDKERRVICEEINLSQDTPSQLVNMLIDEVLWPGHQLGRDIAGSQEMVTAMTLTAMLDYRKQQYHPANAVVTVAGSVGHDEAVSAITEMLGGWEGHQSPRDFAPFTPTKADRLRLVTRKTEQAHICLALPGLSLTDPRRFVLQMANIVLGEGMSSRLFAEIREKLGLAYSINSYLDHFQDSGALTVYAGVDKKNLETAISAIREQLHRLREPIPEDELNRAREFAKGRLLLRLEDSRSVASWLGGQEVLTGKIITPDELIAIIDAITSDDIVRLANELINDNELRLSVVGPVRSEAKLLPLIS